MKLSPSVEHIWRLAASEMVIGHFKEIEPEHFCMAVLKFAELPSGPAGAHDRDRPEVAGIMAADASLLRDALHRRGIDSRSARRMLRGKLGKGGSPPQNGTAHRSAASRALFEIAAAFAVEAGIQTLTPLHLLTALMQSPTPAIAQAVLGQMPEPPATADVLRLDEYGRDLAKEAAAHGLGAGPAGDVLSKAILQILLRKERKSVLLIADRHDPAERVAVAVACAMAAGQHQVALRGRRLIDVCATGPQSDRPSLNESEQLERLRLLLAEAATQPDIVLFVPAVEAESDNPMGRQWIMLLKQTLEIGNVQFVCRVASTLVTRHLRKDSVWKRQTEAVSLEKSIPGTIPREL